MNEQQRPVGLQKALALAAVLACAAAGAGILLWRQGSGVSAGRDSIRLQAATAPVAPRPSLGAGTLLPPTQPLTMEQLRSKAEAYAIEKLISPPVPDADNLALLLMAAAKAASRQTPAWDQFDQLDSPYPLDEKRLELLEAALQEKAEALRLFDKAHEALQRKGVDWKVQYKKPLLETLLPHLNDQRHLGNIVRAAAEYAHARDDDAEALRRLRQALLQADAVDKDPFMVSHLVSIGISTATSHSALSIAPDIRLENDPPTKEQLKGLIAELLDDAVLNDGLVKCVALERASFFEVAVGLAERKLPMDVVAAASGRRQAKSTPQIDNETMTQLILEDAPKVEQFFAKSIEAAKASDWPAARAALPRMKELAEPTLRKRPLLALVPALEGGMQQHYRGLTARRLAAVALAITAYQRDNRGQLPPTLDTLVPAYLPKVPLDPMAAGSQAIRYTLQPQPILYSVGDNGIDEKGMKGTSEMVIDSRGPDVVYHLKAK